MAHPDHAAIEWTLTPGELVGAGRGRLGDRRPDHQPRRRPLPEARGPTSRSGLPADIRSGRDRPEGPDAPVKRVRQPGGANPRVRWRDPLPVDRRLYQIEDYVQQVLGFEVREGRAGPGREDGGVLRRRATRPPATRSPRRGASRFGRPDFARGARATTLELGGALASLRHSRARGRARSSASCGCTSATSCRSAPGTRPISTPECQPAG